MAGACRAQGVPADAGLEIGVVSTDADGPGGASRSSSAAAQRCAEGAELEGDARLAGTHWIPPSGAWSGTFPSSACRFSS
jgi:hypothetical protein